MTAAADFLSDVAAARLMLAGVVSTPALMPKGAMSVALLSPDEPAWWPHLKTMPEWQDGQPDPVDRWSARVLSQIAGNCGGTAILPSDGPPYAPFYSWALESGRCHSSPVRLLVHAEAGLFISFRGAIALPFCVALPALASPCLSCVDRPCLTACPAAALGAEGYDVPACHSFLDRPEGADCLTGGCRVRRACPVGKGRRDPSQSAHHMRYFHK